ncbi:glycosyltransferase 61 family protein [uncultured Methylobacterium sp.]|uniref:glycosyltransferase 61 family protein n=1 Tax=uncultured Methylobacterium sp. TaxID=157278 RepID=UPI00262481B8|nr:glycosyltransferase 61 family protein [uncultured Methylobacterium sp.]
MPTITHFKDAVVSPLLPGSTKHRMFIQKSDFSEQMMHWRYSNGKPQTCTEQVEGEPPGDVGRTLDDAIYGGLIWHNYGHFLAETIHRLWPCWTGQASSDAPILFHPTADRFESILKNKYYGDILGYLSIDASRITLIDQPILCKNLAIPEQAKLLGHPADASYYEQFGAIPVEASEKSRIYVSRGRHLLNGSYLGERIIEEKLAEAGFRVIYPEHLGIKQLVAMYRAADLIVFSEGSAIHVLEVAGKISAHVMIIARRSDTFTKTNFLNAIVPVCRSVELLSNRATLTPMKWDPRKQQPTNSLASAYVDLNAMLKIIAERCAVDIPEVPEHIVKAEIHRDLLKTIFSVNYEHLSDETIGKLIRKLQKQVLDLSLLD